MTVPEYEELIAFLRQHIADLTAERDRLRAESANASEALAGSHEINAELSAENFDMKTALDILGLGGNDDDVDGSGREAEARDT